MPETFGDPAEEAIRIRSAVGLQDVSPLGKLDIKGSAIDARVPQCERLEGVRAALLHKPGHALLLTAPRRESMVRDSLAGVFGGSPGCVHITDVTSALTVLALVGPRATELLAGLTSIDLRPRTLRAVAYGGYLAFVGLGALLGVGTALLTTRALVISPRVFSDDWTVLPAPPPDLGLLALVVAAVVVAGGLTAALSAVALGRAARLGSSS